MLRALTALVFACLCFAAWPRSALAQRVLLARPPATDTTLSEAFNRLRAELILQDFEVDVLDVEGRKLSPDALQEAAQQHDAFAGVALTRSDSGATADVCIADRVTGKISLRRLAITAGEDSPRVLAVRAVDLLRESLRELRAGERPPVDVVGVAAAPAPPAVETFAARERLQLSAAGFALVTTSSISNGYGVGIGFWYWPTARFGVGALLVGPLLGARYRSANGDASLRQELGQLRATFNLLKPARLAFGPVLAAGVYHLQAQGEVETPFAARTASVWSFAGSCGVEGRLSLTGAVSLNAAAHALLLAPEPIVAVDTESEALGQPLLLASVGLGVAF
jgi:hypothetical protein